MGVAQKACLKLGDWIPHLGDGSPMTRENYPQDTKTHGTVAVHVTRGWRGRCVRLSGELGQGSICIVKVRMGKE